MQSIAANEVLTTTLILISPKFLMLRVLRGSARTRSADFVMLGSTSLCKFAKCLRKCQKPSVSARDECLVQGYKVVEEQYAMLDDMKQAIYYCYW